MHDSLPQCGRGGKSPYCIRNGREPSMRSAHVKATGCPCKFCPMRGPVHKRAERAQDGWFIEVQWPMALVLRKYGKCGVCIEDEVALL